jgi:hypothetical protein
MNEHHPMDDIAGKAADRPAPDSLEEAAQDPMLQAVLQDFRASVHAWSEATYQSRSDATSRSKTLVLSPFFSRTLWNRSLAWAMSLALAAGVASTGTYEYHQREQARQAAARQELEHQRQLVQQHAREADDLLAKVDSDVAREVPSAMEPLTGLMPEDETQ